MVWPIAEFGSDGCGFHWPSQRSPAVTVTLFVTGSFASNVEAHLFHSPIVNTVPDDECLLISAKVSGEKVRQRIEVEDSIQIGFVPQSSRVVAEVGTEAHDHGAARDGEVIVVAIDVRGVGLVRDGVAAQTRRSH